MRNSLLISASLILVVLGISFVIGGLVMKDPTVKKMEDKFERWLDEDAPEPSAFKITGDTAIPIQMKTSGAFEILFDSVIEGGRLYIQEGEPRVETKEGLLDEYGEPYQYVELPSVDGALLFYPLDPAVPEIKTNGEGRQYIELPMFWVDRP